MPKHQRKLPGVVILERSEGKECNVHGVSSLRQSVSCKVGRGWMMMKTEKKAMESYTEDLGISSEGRVMERLMLLTGSIISSNLW